jgi:hypothetical protein
MEQKIGSGGSLTGGQRLGGVPAMVFYGIHLVTFYEDDICLPSFLKPFEILRAIQMLYCKLTFLDTRKVFDELSRVIQVFFRF